MNVNFRALVCFFAVSIFLSGCWNGENINLRMGDVSVGQQLIDLKRALDEDAIKQEEYERLRVTIMQIADACGNQEALTGKEQSGEE